MIRQIKTQENRMQACRDSGKEMSTTALPRVPLLQLDSHSGVKSGLTTYRRRVLLVAFEYSKTGHTAIPIRPSDA